MSLLLKGKRDQESKKSFKKWLDGNYIIVKYIFWPKNKTAYQLNNTISRVKQHDAGAGGLIKKKGIMDSSKALSELAHWPQTQHKYNLFNFVFIIIIFSLFLRNCLKDLGMLWETVGVCRCICKCKLKAICPEHQVDFAAATHLWWTDSKRKSVRWSEEFIFQIVFGKQGCCVHTVMKSQNLWWYRGV